MSRKMIAAVFVQARASDGKKRTERDTITCCRKERDDYTDWLNKEILDYKKFKAICAAHYPNHRRRLAYAVRVYAKAQQKEG